MLRKVFPAPSACDMTHPTLVSDLSYVKDGSTEPTIFC